MAVAAARRGRAGQGWLAREPKASLTAAVAHIASLFLLALSVAVVVCAVIGLAFIA
jgi:hypothetical protein